ncbi:MAG: hypothetical protein BMS9Abin10_0334 [Gammaproteobacteria bacterium]|nr:MAG: hypothetical protein BMS9Abin10_0334 [Gammaproteobacteria bacterium]
MKLEYDLIEDSFDDTTHIRTMTEQAALPNKGWLIRTTLYTPHQIAASVTFVPDANAKDRIFDSVVP